MRRRSRTKSWLYHLAVRPGLAWRGKMVGSKLDRAYVRSGEIDHELNVLIRSTENVCNFLPALYRKRKMGQVQQPPGQEGKEMAE